MKIQILSCMKKKRFSKDNLTLERVQNHRKLSAYLVGKVCVEYLRIYNSLLDLDIDREIGHLELMTYCILTIDSI